MEKLTTLFLTLVVILPLQSANLEVDIPWDFEQMKRDAQLIENSHQPIFEDLEWENNATDAQYALFWGIQVLDVYSTYRGLKFPCVKEANPLLGENPGIARMVTHKTIFLQPIWALQSKGLFTKQDLKVYNTMGTIVLYNNYTVLKRAEQRCPKR